MTERDRRCSSDVPPDMRHKRVSDSSEVMDRTRAKLLETQADRNKAITSFDRNVDSFLERFGGQPAESFRGRKAIAG